MNRQYSVKIGDPADRDIVHTRNDTFILPFRAFGSDGNPYDFTDHEFLMEIKDHIDSDEDYLSIPNNSFNITQDDLGQEEGVNNLVIINHKDTFFTEDFNDYVYDIQMTLPSGVVQTIVKGLITIEPDVAQDA